MSTPFAIIQIVFKKEDEKNQEVQGGEAFSTGTYAFNT